jgi:VAD1 Analog of StAR-related lipid transfer domain
VLPIHIDTLFQLLFEKSQFYLDFHDSRKTTDLVQGEWTINEEGQKQRVCSLTIAITQTVGPKSAQVTETQLMRSESMAGQLYSIDVSSVNAGIPYADSFYVCMHYCITRTTENNSLFSVHAQIKYKKSVWGVVKGFIEKNTWAGLEEYFLALLRALQSEYCIAPIKVKRRKGRGERWN